MPTKYKHPGRPQIGIEPRRRHNVTLTDSELKRARGLGNGNASLGISRALLSVDSPSASFENDSSAGRGDR